MNKLIILNDRSHSTMTDVPAELTFHRTMTSCYWSAFAIPALCEQTPHVGSSLWGKNGGYSWWRHQMDTCSALLANLCGEFTSHRWIPHTQRSVTRSFDFFVCAWINDWGWWFETPSNSLWRHCNASWWTTNRGVGDLRSPWLMWYHHMVWIKPIYISLFRAAF